MPPTLPDLRGVFVADRLEADRGPASPSLGLAWLTGRLTEIAGGADGARLTAAMGLVREAQIAGEPAAWIAVGESRFFPPDAGRAGVDVVALPVVQAPDVRGGLDAAVRLARSGAFGLLVVDLVDVPGQPVPVAALSQLVGLGQAHDTAVVFLTCKAPGDPSIHSLIGVRGQAGRIHAGPGRWLVRFTCLKDKRAGPGWRDERPVRPPPGVP